MKHHPTLFAAPMVLALLDGSKTQTRRMVTPKTSQIGSLPQACWPELDFSKAWIDPGGTIFGPGPYLKAPRAADDSAHRVYSRIEVGDRLWVRETLRCKGAEWFYGADDAPVLVAEKNYGECLSWAHHNEKDTCVSIHMPRWASRITLEVTELRVQHVQDCSAEDAIAEGITVERCGCEVCRHSIEMCPADKGAALEDFRALWVEINGEETWNANGWTWVYTFKRVEQGAT